MSHPDILETDRIITPQVNLNLGKFQADIMYLWETCLSVKKHNSMEMWEMISIGKTAKVGNLLLDKNLYIFSGQQFLRRSISDCHIQSHIAVPAQDD